MSLQKLLELEKNPSIPIFHKALAAIRTHYSLDPNLDELFWKSLWNFEKMDPVPTPELAPFLCKLSTKTLTNKQIAIVGNIAYKSNILDELPLKFTFDYIKSLGDNPFRAIELVKRYKLPYRVLLNLYLKADQFKAAESLAQSNQLDDGAIVDFIVHYARAKDQASVDRWISKLIAPSPEHLSKVKHFLLLYNMEANGAHFSIEKRPKLDTQKDIQLVTAVNQLVCKYPSALEGDIYQKWAQMLLGNLEVLSELLNEIAGTVVLGSDDLGQILRFAPLPFALELVDKMNYEQKYPNMTCSDWCIVLNRLEVGHPNVDLMVEQIKYSQCLHDTNVISSLCRLQPHGLIDAVLGLETAPNDYQLLSCWKSAPTRAQATRLETFSAAPSFAFLRAVVSAYYQHNDFVAIARWLHKYQHEYGFELPEQFLQELKDTLSGIKVSPKKLGAPSPGAQDWTCCVRKVFPPWINVDWVIGQF